MKKKIISLTMVFFLSMTCWNVIPTNAQDVSKAEAQNTNKIESVTSQKPQTEILSVQVVYKSWDIAKEQETICINGETLSAIKASRIKQTDKFKVTYADSDEF